MINQDKARTSFQDMLFRFISSNTEAAGYLNTAQISFFEDISDKYRLSGITDIKELFGRQEFEIFYTCMLEYYSSSLYPHPTMSSFWNVIDELLKKTRMVRGDELFLKAMKESYVSLYEVSDNICGNTVTLNDLIQGGAVVEVERNDVMKSYIGTATK